MGVFDSLFSKKKSTPINYVELQNILFRINENKLVVTIEQIYEAANMHIANNKRIIDDCCKLINNTKVPSVFLKRYETLENCTAELVKIEKFNFFQKPYPSEQLEKVKAQYPQASVALANRIWDENVQKRANLKTDRAKERNLEGTIELLQKYCDYFPKEYREHVDSLIQSVQHSSLTSPTYQDLISAVCNTVAQAVPSASCVQEDNPEFVRIHITGADNRKLAIVKIMKSDQTMQAKKLGQDFRTLTSVDELRGLLV